MKTDTQIKSEMVDKALALAVKIGFANLTRANISEACGITPSLVNHRFGTMTEMRRTIARAAIRSETLPVIAELVATKNPLVKKIPDSLKARAIAQL
jgi:AcrR family transcriptional regulator